MAKAQETPNWWPICQACGCIVDKKSRVVHHVSYEPEITLVLCTRCHELVHDENIDSNSWIKRNFAPVKGVKRYGKFKDIK